MLQITMASKACKPLCECGKHRAGQARKTHGMRHTPMYNAWCHMRARCENPNNKDYRHYGGRGISVCKRWETFEGFLADMGDMPPDNSIERRDTNGNYEPSNCEWIPKVAQPRNTRRTRYAVLDGERLIFSDVARKLGISSGLVTLWAKGRRRIPPGIEIAFIE